MIYIDADPSLRTWRHIKEIGDYHHFQGRAQEGDTVIRWGCNYSRYSYPDGVRVLNKRIILSKIDQAHLFQEGNVPMPKVYWTVTSWERDGRPQVVRKPALGQMGTGIRLEHNPNFHQTDAIHQQFIDKEREFRVMQVGDIIAFLMEKHAGRDLLRWNEHRGATWSSVPEDQELRRKLREIGKKVLKALEYDFGAIDIMLKDTHLYVLECNSRPELGENSAGRFVRAISQYLGR
jgi:glutathione synthase/RimK-type ligase-like ATP-grasp enzyme